MATNNNGSNGVLRGGTGSLPNKGVGAAFEQKAFRKEYANKVFEQDTGYLATSLKSLKQQEEYYKKILKDLQDQDTAQTRMAKKRLNEVELLKSRTQQMYDKQEASEASVIEVLKKQHTLRMKQLEEQYSHEKELLDKMDKNRRAKQQAIVDEIAAEIEEQKEQIEEVEEAAEKAKKSTKSIGDGLLDSIKKVTDIATDLTNLINIQSIADNEFAQKANERYEIINDLNRSLGYNVSQSTSAYNSITSEFKAFNNNMGNLFNIDDMKEYMQSAAQLGITNETLLRDNLEQSVIATKYMGLSNDSQMSMYKYMKYSNNNDAINNYNKLMVSLTKQGIGVSEDLLDEVIKNGQDTSEILAASGINIEEYNEGKMAQAAALQSQGYDEDTALAMVGMVDSAIQDLYNMDYESLVKKGMNPFELSSMAANSSFDELYNYVMQGTNSMSANNNGYSGVFETGVWNNQLGISASEDMYSDMATRDADEVSDTTKSILDQMNSTSDDEVEQYVKMNTALDDLTRLANKNNVWMEDTFNNSWFDYSDIAKVFFTTAIAGNIIQIISSGYKAITGISSFLGAGSAGGGIGSSIAAALGVESSGGLATLLGTAGPIALGIGAVGAIAAAIDSHVQKVTEEEHTNTSEGISQTAKANLNSGKNTTQSAATFNAIADLYGTDYHKKYSREEMKSMGFDTSLFSNRNQEIESGYYERKTNNQLYDANKAVIAQIMNQDKHYGTIMDSGNGSLDYSREDALLAAAILLDKNSMLKDSDVFEYLGQNDLDLNSKEDIKKMCQDLSNDNTYVSIPNLVKAGLDILSQVGISLLDSNGNSIDLKITSDELSDYTGVSKDEIPQWYIDTYSMAGLDKVPRDNYRALLHQGEMVLNKKDADAYRLYKEDLKNYNKGARGGFSVSQNIGDYNSGYSHSGIDLYFRTIGTPVGSAVAGTVTESRDILANYSDGKAYHGKDTSGTAYSSYGRVVKVKGDENGKTYIYGHLNERKVNAGDKVSAGTLLGYSGTTGNSSGPHLHFEIQGLSTSSAPHAEYYTPYVRSADGAAATTVASTTDNSSNSNNKATLKMAKQNTTGTRLIPGMGGSENIPDTIKPVDRIVNSVDGVSEKIIRYLDEIRTEQEDQRRLINAFSMSQQID